MSIKDIVCMLSATAMLSAAAPVCGASFTAESFDTDDGETVNYWLFTPDDAAEDMPLIIYLHGGSGKGDDLSILAENGFCKWVSEGLFDDTPAYMIFPQVSSQYNGWGSAKVRGSLKQLIDYTVDSLAVDRDNISLTGHSMGGTGTYTMGLAYSGLFSRLAPMSGSINVTAENVSAFMGTSVWAFVGSEDDVVPPVSSIEFINSFNEMGGSGYITVFEGASHFDVPELAYLDERIDIIGWLISGTNEIRGIENDTASIYVAEPGAYTLMFAEYGENGELRRVTTKTVELIRGENHVKIPGSSSLTGKGKIMLWESSKNMRPACEAFVYG